MKSRALFAALAACVLLCLSSLAFAQSGAITGYGGTAQCYVLLDSVPSTPACMHRASVACAVGNVAYVGGVESYTGPLTYPIAIDLYQRPSQVRAGILTISQLPSIAGQALNSWTPRSLSGQLGAFGTLAAASQNPALAGILAAQSPRLVGGGAYALGAANRGVGNLLGQSGITPSRVQLGALLGSRMGDLEEEGLLNYGN